MRISPWPRAAYLLLLGTLAAGKAPSPEDFPVEISTPDGSVTAHFDGIKPSPGTKAPLERGATRLFFTFQGDKTALVFENTGTMLPETWTFELFSPDGAWVLLPQGTDGPVHVVKTAMLREYLTGARVADRVLVTGGPGLRALRWKSGQEVEFRLGGAKKPVVVPLGER